MISLCRISPVQIFGVSGVSNFWIGNLFLMCSILCGSVSQLFFKIYLNKYPPLKLDASLFKLLFSGVETLLLLAACILLVAGFGFWVLSLSRLDLSYAYPIASASVLLVTALSFIFLGETMTLNMWLGTVLVVAGVILLAHSEFA